MSDLEFSPTPPEKRLRRDPSMLHDDEESENWRRVQKWSLLNKEVLLDTTVDMGIGRLESDSEEPSHEDTYPDFLDLCLPPTMKVCDKHNDRIAKIVQNTTKSIETFRTLSKNHFQQLSDEVILHIFRGLPKSCLANAALVCHRWYQLAQDESLWSRMDLSNRYLEPGAIGYALSRQVVILRLTSSEICDPPILPCVNASLTEFRSRLLYLDLSMAMISPSSLTMLLSKCYRLKKLSLEHITIDDNVLDELSHNRELEVLNLAMVEGLTKTGIHYLLSNCWKLKELNFAWTNLNCASIKFLCSHLPSTVDRLNLSGCRQQIHDENIQDLVAMCPNLRELDLSDCTGLTGRTIQSLIHLEELNFLALSRCYFIPHRCLLLLKTMKSLTYLDMYGGHIEGEELEEVANCLGSNVNINKFKFSSVARPTVGQHRCTIWGFRVRD